MEKYVKHEELVLIQGHCPALVSLEMILTNNSFFNF